MCSEERLGVHGFVLASEEFVDLVELLSLQDLPLIGLEFTFFESGGGAQSA